MAWILLVTDQMVTDYHSDDLCKCPLSQALEAELLKRGAPVSYVFNANEKNGGITYMIGTQTYRVYPINDSERQAAIAYIATIDSLELGQPYPRKHVFHYSNPEAVYYGR